MTSPAQPSNEIGIVRLKRQQIGAHAGALSRYCQHGYGSKMRLDGMCWGAG